MRSMIYLPAVPIGVGVKMLEALRLSELYFGVRRPMAITAREGDFPLFR
jgi:hypothetical protein